MPVESRRKALIQGNQSRRWGDRVQHRPHTGAIQSPSNDCVYPSPSPYATRLPEERQTSPVVDHSREEDHCSNSDSGTGSDLGSLPTDATATSSSGRQIAMISTQGWSMDVLLDYSSNFVAAERISATSQDLAKTMKDFECRGEPLVLEGYNNHPKWPHEIFTLDYFMKHAVSNEISVRNVHDWTDKTMNLADFVETCRSAFHYATADEQVRLYGKDTECPKPWEHWLENGGVIPSSLVGNGPQDLFRHRPKSASVQTLMCYLGIGDTFTPCHKDLCASSGQNLMCYTEDGGASFWFMTKGSSSVDAAKYFQRFGQELDHENYVINLNELAKAPFKIYIIEQKIGDLVLVPPRSCHQVVNFGGITVKMSWSRMTLEGLSMAYHHELPIYRRVCRPEIYRVKSTIHYALLDQTKQLQSLIGRKSSSSTSFSKLVVPKAFDVSALKKLLSLYDCVLAEEYARDNENMHHIIIQQDALAEEDHLTCDFCGGDIFQSFFDCARCTEDGNPLHICPGCFVEGRHCKCQHMRSVQFRDFRELVQIRDQAEEVIRQYEERHRRMFRQELALQNASVPPLFQAACYLNKIRKTAKRSCAFPTPHGCLPDCALYCRQCHGSRCFPHITGRWHVHSSEALMAHGSDKTHSTYHKTHLLGKKKFLEDEQTLEQSQKLGTRHQGYSLLLNNALNFVQCNPINSRFLTRGWYDTKYEVLDDQVADDGGDQRPASRDVSSSSSVQDVTVQALETSQLDGDSDLMAVDIVMASRKRPSFYIDVPRAPYSIRRALSGCIGQSSAKDPPSRTNHLESSGPSDQRHREDSLRGPAIERSLSSPLQNSSALRKTSEGDTPVVPGSDKAAKKKSLSSLRFKKKSDAGCGETSPGHSAGISQEGCEGVIDDHVERNTSSSANLSPPAFLASNGHRPASNYMTSSMADSAMPGPFTSSSVGSPVSQMQDPVFLDQTANFLASRTIHLVGVTLQNAAQTLGLPQTFAQYPADTRSDLSRAHPLMSMPFDNRSGDSGQARHATSRNSVFRHEDSSMQYGMHGPGSHPASRPTNMQAPWNKGPPTPPNYRPQKQHINNRLYENAYSSWSPQHRGEPYNDGHKYKYPRYPYHDLPSRPRHPFQRNRSDEPRNRHDRPSAGQRSDVDELREWTPSPHYRSNPQRSDWHFDLTTHRHAYDESSRAHRSPTRHGTGRGREMRFNIPSRPHYADGSQAFDAVYNAQYMYHRDRWEQDNITIMDLTPSLPNEDVLDEQTRQSAGPNTNPFCQEDFRKGSPSMSFFKGDSQTSNNLIVSNLESRAPSNGPLPVSSEGFSESRGDIGRASMEKIVENPGAGSNEDRSVNTGHVSETRSPAETQQWEDDYDQSGKEESLPRQKFKHTIIKYTNVEDNISLGPEEDELTRNNWI